MVAIDTEIHFSILHSSRTRFWDGFEATIYQATPGVDETLCGTHSISMHLSRPVNVTSKCDGTVIHKLQQCGDLKIIPAGYSRTWEIEGPARKLTMKVADSLVEEAADGMGLARPVSIPPQLDVRDRRIEHIGWALVEELDTDEPLGRIYGENLGRALASHIVRRYGRPAESAKSPLSRRKVYQVFDYVNEHLPRDLSLTELARLVTMSPSHFNVCFKAAVGLSAHQFVLRTRVERAMQSLLDDSLSLSEVALQCGFSSQSHMASSIRRIAGVTPGQVRANLR